MKYFPSIRASPSTIRHTSSQVHPPDRVSHLQAPGLLADLHDVFAPELALPPLVVLLLVGELRLVLQADQVGPLALDGVELAELQLLHGLVVPQQHGVLQVPLGLTLVQLLVGTDPKI